MISESFLFKTANEKITILIFYTYFSCNKIALAPLDHCLIIEIQINYIIAGIKVTIIKHYSSYIMIALVL